MKNITINEKNRDRINTFIKEKEGRATVRKIDYEKIIKAINLLETHLRIKKKDMEGITAHIDVYADEYFPNAYKYTPYSTHFKIERKKGYWSLKDVFREICGYHNRQFILTLPESAEKAIIAVNTKFDADSRF